MNKSTLSKAVRCALMAGAATALAAPAVFAQDPHSSSNQNQNSNTAQLGKIEVVGSRILRSSVETAQPVTIITAKQLKETGLTSIGDILQQISSAGSALNTMFNNGGDGETFIDLRNLGAARVLVLVNGRRWMNDLGGPVDLNTIPVSIIDHIEILQDGASAIYGSDAIAGVINIITIKNFNGAEAHAYLGMYDGHGVGGGWDGKTQEYDFTLGNSGNRGGVLMNVSYVNQQPIWAGQRTISYWPVIGADQNSGSSATLAGRFFIFPAATPGKCPGTATPTPTSGSCDLTLTSYPTNTPTLGNFTNWANTDRYNYAPSNYLVTPNERTSLYVQGHYQLRDNLTFSTDVMYNRRVSQQILAPMPLFIGAFGNNFSNTLPIGIGASNPFNPFGVNLVPNYGSACVAAGTCDVLGFAGRRMVEAGQRMYNQNRDSYQIHMGLKGYFNTLGSEWDWDVGYNYGTNYETDVTTGLMNTQRMQYALNNCTASGGAVSGSNPLLPGCTPLNFFGGAGSITPAMLQYILFEAHDVMITNMRDYTGNITGDLFNLPAGPLAMAAGYEYLEQDGFFHPDALTSEGNTSGNVTQPTNGREVTKAEYVEFDVPLVADAPFMKSLSLHLANRWSQFNWIGGNPGTALSTITHFDHASTGLAALRWQVTDTLLLRASWSQGFRVPSISGLYFGNSDSFPTIQDPCVGATKAPFCGAGPYTQPNGQIRTTVGGNPNMTPEKSISQTVGFVYSPDWLPGFDFSADYYKINLVNALSSIPPQTILDGCYFGNNPNYCKLIQRGAGNYNAPGAITDILDLNTNVGGIKTEGVDISTHYKFPSTAVGDFMLGLNWTFTKEYVVTEPFGSQGLNASLEEAGTTGTTSGAFSGIPKQRAHLALNWNYGNWSALWAVQYIGGMTEDCQSVGLYFTKSNPLSNYCPTNGTFPFASGTVPLNHIGATFYHDVQATYHMDSWNTDFTFGIRNLFDKVPPIAMSAFANSFLPTYYRAPGRFFYVRVGVKF